VMKFRMVLTSFRSSTLQECLSDWVVRQRFKVLKIFSKYSNYASECLKLT
jgi:hypothetical protein